MANGATQENIANFCAVTGASVKDAKKHLEKYKRVDVAVDAYFNDPHALDNTSKRPAGAEPSTSKLGTLYSKYEDKEAQEIGIDGTIRMCSDLGVDPEDIVLLAVAYELKSPSMGVWKKAGWVDGWKALGCDTIESMKQALPRLRTKLASDPAYFRKVYSHTFNFARSEGQRSLALDSAQAFWSILIPHGLSGGALSHTTAQALDGDDEGEDVTMADASAGWKPAFTELWFEFLNEKGGKGVSKDTWNMFLDFVRTIDPKFGNYDPDAAWPSTIDDFVAWVKTGNKLS